jgi:pimeloyl-ACP methyl ester carboxylesterase
MARVDRRTGLLAGEEWAWHEAEGGDVPVLYVHGVPTAGFDWDPFLAVTGGLAPDLPGFGASAKPAGAPYDGPFFAAALERFLAWRGVDRVRLVVHDWGAGWGLLWAQDHPGRVERLVILNGVPLTAAYRWHWVARVWRTRGAGEAFMRATNGATLAALTRLSNTSPGPLPAAWRAEVLDAFDAGTRRAILRLYRWGDPERLGRAGARLGELTCPALVLWGARDPYIPVRFAQVAADQLGGPTEVEVVDGAGHWGWLDRPAMVDRVATFLSS